MADKWQIKTKTQHWLKRWKLETMRRVGQMSERPVHVNIREDEAKGITLLSMLNVNSITKRIHVHIYRGW